MTGEALDRRVLGALRLIDVTTGIQVRNTLTMAAPGVKFIRNRSGYYVILAAPGLAAHTAAFDQLPVDRNGQPLPPLESVSIELTLRDPSQRYLPIRHVLRLPRDPDPAHGDAPNSLFRPIDIRLFPTPSAPTASTWAVIRATVLEQGTNQAAPGTLIRVLRPSNPAQRRLIGSGLANEHGEALISVHGVPASAGGEGTGAVVTFEIDAVLQTVRDPAANGLPQPEDLEARQASLPSGSTNVKLAAGRTVIVQLTVPAA